MSETRFRINTPSYLEMQHKIACRSSDTVLVLEVSSGALGTLIELDRNEIADLANTFTQFFEATK